MALSSTLGSAPLKEVLSHTRTLGYPVFLKCVKVLSPSFELLPICHFVVYICTVFIFYMTLRRLGFLDWLAMAISSSLLYSDFFFREAQGVGPDILALSLAILAIAMLFLVVCNPRNLFAWLAMTFFLFFTYQCRPDYIFLIPLLPLLGLLTAWPIQLLTKSRYQFKRVGLGLIMACVFPFFVFSAFRGVVLVTLGWCHLTVTTSWVLQVSFLLRTLFQTFLGICSHLQSACLRGENRWSIGNHLWIAIIG